MTLCCPCGTQRSYEQCCRPFHLGTALPTTAEQLMRSRYSAFHQKLADYLVATLHPHKRSANEQAFLQANFDDICWKQLTILQTHRGNEGDEFGEVEFIAEFTNRAGQIDHLHERSRFVHEDNRWFYVDGKICQNEIKKTPGRNAPCWCGSGKKTKRCHGR